MPARLIAYLPDTAAVCLWIDEAEGCRIGRDATATLRLEHPSVSRQHAELRYADGAWRIRDLSSKNGIYLDGVRCTDAVLGGRHWLRCGEVDCEFVHQEASAGVAYAQRQREREARSTGWGERLAQVEALPQLLDETLQAVLNLAECERGFLLLPGHDGWQVRATVGIDGARLGEARFAGSRTALDRALQRRTAVVINDTARDVELARRASVLDGQIRALLALPLLHGDAVLALIYADRVRTAEPLSDFDLRLLQAFCERAAVWLAARRGAERLRQLPALDWPAVAA